MPPSQPNAEPNDAVGVESLLEESDCLLWRSTVVRLENRLQWLDFDLPHSALSLRIFGQPIPARASGLWTLVTAPDLAQMNARSTEAILAGAAGYEQEFRVVRDGRLFWLHERTSIRPLHPDRWQVSGVVTDITAQREAEEARRATEEEVHQILTVANCMIWRARAFRRRSGMDADWVLYIPPSSLYWRLFGEDAPTQTNTLWHPGMVPELEEMNARSNAALLNGAPEYEHEFRVLWGARVLWMHEHVSITQIAPGEWSLTGVLMDVTAAREAEESRRASEARLQQLLARADCILWQARVAQMDDEWVRLNWTHYLPQSELFARVFKDLPESEHLLDWDKLKVPEFPEMRARVRQALRTGGAGYEHEFHVPRADGPPIWLHEQVTIRPAGPRQWDLIGFITDVSARRAAEEAHRQSEAQMHQILTSVDCLLWQATVVEREQGEPLWTVFAPHSALYQKLFGKVSPETADGRVVLDWAALQVPELPEMMRRYQQALRERQPGYEQEFRAFVPPRTYWLHEQVTIQPLGEKRWQLVGVITDITARREAEMALAAEKERLAVTLRAMAEGVITTDTQGIVQFINPAAAVLTQWDPGDAVGRPIAEVCVLQDEHHGQPIHLPLDAVVRGDRVAELPSQTRMLAHAGARWLVEGCCAPIHTANSLAIGAVFVFRDVTERERLAQELVRASRLESVGILAGGIAHDFNNILTVIMGNVSMALLDLDPAGYLGKCLKEAESATLRARDLTQQLLTFAKGGEPVRTAVQLGAIVREVSDFSLHGSRVKGQFDLPDGLWPVDADKGQIGRVVQNLVLNAVQAMPEGGTVRISARNEAVGGLGRAALIPGDYVHFSIADTGIGIKPENLPHIFDPYFTTKQTGSGLGLAAVYSIVRKHRGLIDLASTPGQGTTFHVWLPALRSAAVPVETGRTPQANTLCGRVLFMDDEASIRKVAASLLRRFGLEVVAVADGRAALDEYRAARHAGRPFALVIMDLTVPGGMGGREALEQLRRIDPQVKAIVSSGYSSDPVLANYRHYGFCGVVVKPYEVGEFGRIIAETLAPGDAPGTAG